MKDSEGLCCPDCENGPDQCYCDNGVNINKRSIWDDIDDLNKILEETNKKE